MERLKPFQLGIAAQLIQNYKGDQPFSSYFAAQCKLHRNWGSRDRKIYRQACYTYFRLGYAASGASIESILQFSGQEVDAILEQIPLADIFPHKQYLSTLINSDEWMKHLLFQHPVYIAPRENRINAITDYLNQSQIPFEKIDKAIKVKSDTNCKEIIDNGMGWIMDISSQRAADSIEIAPNSQVWDCCSGAGGKSLYLSNKFKSQLYLTCSDKRFTILQNLKERFKLYGIHEPAIELCDLTSPFQLDKKFDIILADVPCSGSGTWGRTPENITGTPLHKIGFYAELQKNIVRNALKNLKPGGRLYYVTCSVFSDENEANAHYFTENFSVILKQQKYYHDSANTSDWLFVAELEKK
ncbi:MAG: hypothetical protein V4613_05125 [Bacteroidota bacterium]